MPDSLKQITGQLTKIWGNLSQMQKVSLIGVMVLAIGAVLGVTMWASNPSYQVAFSGMTAEDAGVVVARLKELNIPYKLAGDGATIEVPAARKSEVLLQMASEGLPKSGVGFEVFDKSSFGMTDFMQNVNYQRALEGELARTIQDLSSVQQARVHIAMAGDSLYTSQKTDSTASIMLKFKGGKTIDESQVRGIAMLVARSVEGLDPKNVTIVDNTGTVLSDGLDETGSPLRATASQIQQQHDLEQNMSQNLQAMFDKVLGPDRAVVKVSAEMDWNDTEATTESFQGTPQPSQVHTVTEAGGGSSNTTGGIPGATSNLTTTTSNTLQQVNGVNGSNPITRTESMITYELAKVTETVKKAPGAVKRMNVGVIIDAKAPVDQAQAQAITQLVGTAAGLDPARGDSITLTSLPFERSTIEQQAKEMADAARNEQYMSYGRIAGMVVAPLLLLFFLRRLFKSKSIQVRSVPATVRPLGEGEARGADMLLSNGAAAQITAGLDGGAVQAQAKVLYEQARKAKHMQQQVADMAKKDPAMVAQMLNTWLEEDKPNRR